jgi:hypothetical protein
MATQKQIKANSMNSLKSTGARTPEGKAKVSQNRLSHGLCGTFRVLAHELQEDFEHLLTRLTSDQKPVGDLETEIVRKMAQAMWQRERAVQCQGASFVVEQSPEQVRNDQAEVAVTEGLAVYMRYEAHHDRVFRHALADLLKLQKERRLREIGFERQKSTQAEETHKAEMRQIKKATAVARQQCAEIKLGSAVADMLPPNFDPAMLGELLPNMPNGKFSATS